MTSSFSEALANFATSFRKDHLSEAERDHLCDAFVNWIACAVGGARAPAVDAMIAACRMASRESEHPVLGRPERLGLIDASVIDCLSSAVLAFDDAHFSTGLHPTGPVAAALLAIARTRTISGADYLAALHVGMEIECRVAQAFTAPSAGAKLGWYSTGIAGGVGAAAAVGRILSFDVDQIVNAMALAAARACGNRGTHGSMAAAYVPATATESGLIAAFLTKAGMSCSSRSLDGERGLLELLADRPDTAGALKNLGRTSQAALTAFKPYPAGFVIHAVIDACLQLLEREGFDVNSVATLDLRVSPAALTLADNPKPRDPLEAQVSLQHWAAIVLLHRSAGVEQGDARWLIDPQVAALRERVTVSASQTFANHQCEAVVRMNGGGSHRVFIEHALGSPGRPMSRAQVEAKASALFGAALSPERAARLHERCRQVATLDDVGSILAI